MDLLYGETIRTSTSCRIIIIIVHSRVVDTPSNHGRKSRFLHKQLRMCDVGIYKSYVQPVDLPVARLISHGYPSAKIHLRLYK